MSGRVKVKRDGKLITGYRKTNRRNRRPTEPIEKVLTFQLPPLIAWSVNPGPVNSFVSVDPDGLVTVRSFDANLNKRKARAFIKAVNGKLDVEVELPRKN